MLFFDSFKASLFFSLLSYFLTLRFVLKRTGWNSVFFLFLILFGLYGYSVPVSVYFNLDIGWHRVAKLSTWQMVDNTLISFMVSNQLAFLAILLVIAMYVKRKYLEIDQNRTIVEKRSYLQLSIIAGIFSSLSEFLNFYRVGGFKAIANGKAYYQGAVNDLVLNIPYEGFFFISVGLFGLYLNSVNQSILSRFYDIISYLISISVVLLVNISIGERGSIVVALVIFMLAISYNKRFTRIRGALFFYGFILYLAFNVLTLLREKSITYEGLRPFLNEHGERLTKLMNPANTEFAASALNYRIYMDKRPEDYKYRLGATYAEVFWGFIPTYVWPGKPTSIIYQFRDTYFPERRKQGSTAGTGFSSLMEAHMNFGYLGPLITYLLSALFLIYFETKKGKPGLYHSLLYLLLFNIYLIYSRSASQYILFNLVLYNIQLLIVLVAYRIVPKRAFEYLKLNGARS